MTIDKDVNTLSVSEYKGLWNNRCDDKYFRAYSNQQALDWVVRELALKGSGRDRESLETS